MPTSPSIHKCLPFSHSSANNSLDCTDEIKMCYTKKSENEMKKSLKRDLHKGHALLRKHMQRPILVQTHRSFRRRNTFPAYQESNKVVFKKRRRLFSFATPTKFLLGGTITDPLNLKSLEDDAINQQLNAFSPASSPMPIPPRRSQVQVVIPPNIYDPLNLNTGEEIEVNLLSKSRKRRRHRKSRREDQELDSKDLSPIEELPSLEFKFSVQDTIPSPQQTDKNDSDINDIKIEDFTEEVQTLEEEAPAKSLSLVSPIEESKPFQKQVLKSRRSKLRLQTADTIKFRANAVKFCYGNHTISHCNWNFDNSTDDPRIPYLNADLFRGKDVLDIGCNTGNLTLFIAKNFHPKKITGIDIDKKLVNCAVRQLRELDEHHSCIDMPQSMPFLYGPLAKLLQLKHESPAVFPNNVAFLEANYVPACEDYLDTQKPEYDTILCLRVTKWIHLNYGDDGLKMAFKRMFAQLRIGGHLILESQPWFTYSANKRITPSIYKTYRSLEMRPESFCDYLLSCDVGFSSCDIIGRSINYAKGYRQNIYLLTKRYNNPYEDMLDDMSPIPFHSDQWTPHSDSNFESLSEYLDSASEYSEAAEQC